MISRRRVGTFEDTAHYQELYQSLIDAFDEWGTLVLRDRILEKDKDIAPFRFYRKGTLEYVFPSQHPTLLTSAGYPIDQNPDYELRAEKETFTVDESKIAGRIRIEYTDSGDHPELSVCDLLGNSTLPDAVNRTIEDIF